MPSIRFERTFDQGIVRKILTTPAIYRRIGEDTAPPIAEYDPPEHPSIWNVLAFDGDELLGCFCFYPEGAISWQAHTCLLPSARGRVIEAARGVIDWIWGNSPCLRITTRVPVFNVPALRLAENTSMVRLGTNAMSFLKYGRLHDQALFGISKPGVR